MRKLVRTAMLLAVLCGYDAAARAEDQPSTAHAAIDLSFFSAPSTTFNPSSNLVTPRFRGDLSLGRNMVLGIDWALLFFSSELGANSNATFRISNPMLTAHYFTRDEKVAVRIGGGIAVPLARVPDENRTFIIRAYGAALLAHGLRNLWLWFPDRLSVVLSGGAEVPVGRGFLGFDAAFGTMFDTSDRGGENDTEVVMELVPRLGAHLGPTTFGARIPIIWLPTAETDDKGQVGIEPFVEHRLGRAFIRGAFAFYLDPPAGFSFDTGKTWLLSVGAGATF